VSGVRSKEKLIERSLLVIAYSSIAILFIITFFIFKEGLPFIFREGLGTILGGVEWRPTNSESSPWWSAPFS
jgi:phosphate transport system permease protein